MSNVWEEDTKVLLQKRGTRVAVSLGVDSGVVAYSEEEVTESLEEMRESLELAEGQSEQWASELKEMQKLANECPSEWTEEELQEMAEDAKMLERMEKLREGMDVSSDRLKIIRSELEFLTGEAKVPEVAEVLNQDEELLKRLNALRKSRVNHEIELERVRNATEELIKVIEETETEKLLSDTAELEKLMEGWGEEDDEDVEVGDGSLDEDLQKRLNRLRNGVELGVVELELLKSGIQKLEEIALTSQPSTEPGEVDVALTERLNKLNEGCDTKQLALTRLQISVDELELLVPESEVSENPGAVDEDLMQRLEALRGETTTLEKQLEKFEKIKESLKKTIQRNKQDSQEGVGDLGDIDGDVFADLFASPEDKTAFNEHRKLWAQFRPHLVFGERLKQYEIANELTDGVGHQIVDGFQLAENMRLAGNFNQARTKLEELLLLVKNSRKEIETLKQSMTLETEGKVQEREEVFNFNTKTKDGEFDTDSDAAKFFLANVTGDLGGLEVSPKLIKMQELFAEAIKQANKLRALGATPEEIGRVAMKGIPKAFWPDWMIKEIEMFKRAHEKIQAEIVNAQVDEKEIDAMEKSIQLSSKGVDVAKKVNSACEFLKLGSEQLREQAGDVLDQMASQLEIMSSAYEIGKNIGELMSPGEVIEDNPVKAKMVEFQRNRLIIDTVNKLVSLGCDMLGEIVPALGVVSSGKDTLMEIYNAAMYFKNLHAISKLKKGSKIDPRSAVYLPFCQFATEKKIQASEATLKAITGALETVGKVAEMGAISAPIGLAVDKAAKVIKLAGKVVIRGCKWREAEKAHKELLLAIGPPPLRKAMLEVQKHSTKYARAIMIDGALQGDPWAVRHFENIGVEEADLDNPNTSSELLREYVTLMSGGLMGEQVGEDQERFKDSGVGKVALAVKGGAEKVRDVFIGRKTSAEYKPDWIPPKIGLSRSDWQMIKKLAIQAGWYDDRSGLGDVIDSYEAVKENYDPNNRESVDALYTSLNRVREKVLDVYRNAKANDKTTVHEGMRKVCDNWFDLIDGFLKDVSRDRDILVNQKYANMSEEEKKKKVQEELNEASEKQKKAENQRRMNRKKLIIEALMKMKFKSPYGTFQFNAKSIQGIMKAAKSKLDLSEEAVSTFQKNVLNLSASLAERLSEELSSSTEEDFKKNMALSLEGAKDLTYTVVRQYGEQAYLESNRATPQWQPSPSHIAFDNEQLKSMLKSAEKFGKGSNWDGSGSTSLKKAMKNVVSAQKVFDENKRQFMLPPGNTATEKKRPKFFEVDAKLGLLMGHLETLETELRNFDPETDRGISHSGLVAYREQMVELVVAKRLELDGEKDKLLKQKNLLATTTPQN